MGNRMMMGMTVLALHRLIEHEERELTRLRELDNRLFDAGRDARDASRVRKQLIIAQAQEALAAKGDEFWATHISKGG